MVRDRMLRVGWALAILGMLAACGGPRVRPDVEPAPAPVPAAAPPAAPVPVPAQTAPVPGGKSRWVPVAWSELPGFGDDALHEAWSAWLRSCERAVANPAPVAALCAEVRPLAIADAGAQRAWMQQRLQPHRVESAEGDPVGLLTAYYEPVFAATRTAQPGYGVPLYRAPAGLAARRPWFTRAQIDSLPEAQAALRGREIAWLADPVDAMVLHIQGSGRLRLREADGSERLVRVAFAGTNDQPYQSVGKWLLDRNLVRDATWPGIKAWLAANPQRTGELMAQNPRYVFFREEALDGIDAGAGPRGAQGVPLTAGRSIAVDRASIPYGAPVWLVSPGPQTPLARLVLAQDTGAAIVGAVRADYYAGSGFDAGELAGRLKQPLRMWVLWPR